MVALTCVCCDRSSRFTVVTAVAAPLSPTPFPDGELPANGSATATATPDTTTRTATPATKRGPGRDRRAMLRARVTGSATTGLRRPRRRLEGHVLLAGLLGFL